MRIIGRFKLAFKVLLHGVTIRGVHTRRDLTADGQTHGIWIGVKPPDAARNVVRDCRVS